MAERYYLQEQLDNTKSDHSAGMSRLLVNAATGTGKTVYMSKLPKFLDFGGQTWVLVHRDELAQQTADKMKRWNPDFKIGVEMGDSYADLDSDVVVVGVASLGKEGSTRIRRFDPVKHQVKLIETDEAHHSTAPTYLNIYDYFGVMAGGGKRAGVDVPLLVGVTATPGRGDGEPLAKVFQKITHSYPLRKAIDDGFLCDIRAIKLRTDTDISGVGSRSGDFKIGELSNAVNTPQRNQRIVKAWLDNAKDRPTIAFTADIQHAKDLAAMFERCGVKAAAIWGNDPERAAKLTLHQRGQLQVLCNCGVLTEGYDDWRVSCVIMARPTKSQTLFVQCIGRGTRLQEGIDNLKEALAAGWAVMKRDCLVIDVVDSTSRNSLITVPSIFGLAADLDLKGTPATVAIKILEEAEAAHPNIDFSTLESIDKIDAAVEEANIWEAKYPPEVEKHSTLGWHRAFDGAFVLQIPQKQEEQTEDASPAGKKKPNWLKDPYNRDQDQIRIKQNVLGKWEITARIDGQKYKGERDTVEEAFNAGDGLVLSKASHAIRVLKREAEWHEEEITPSQKRMLTRLLKGKQIPPGIKKGQASRLISQLLAGKVTGRQVAV